MATVRIRRANDQMVDATYVMHLRTLTGDSGTSNWDVDLYRLADGTEIVCIDNGTARSIPSEKEGETRATYGR